MGTPIAGWLSSWKIPLIAGWELKVPPEIGNLQIGPRIFAPEVSQNNHYCSLFMIRNVVWFHWQHLCTFTLLHKVWKVLVHFKHVCTPDSYCRLFVLFSLWARPKIGDSPLKEKKAIWFFKMMIHQKFLRPVKPVWQPRKRGAALQMPKLNNYLQDTFQKNSLTFWDIAGWKLEYQ